MTSNGPVNVLGVGLLIALVGCTRGSSPAPVESAAAAQRAAAPHAFRYHLVVTAPDGSTTASRFVIAASDAAPGSVSVGKNVMIAQGNRSDVGWRIKWRVTMQGETPVLAVDADLAEVDAGGKLHRIALKGSAPTPLGTSTLVVETTQDAGRYRLGATPTAVPDLGAAAPNGKHAVDVTITQTGSGAAASPTQLTLTLDGDAPAVARHQETVPLVAADGGVAVPRQDVGTRVKAVGHPHANGLELDFDLEISGIEGSSPVAIRKIVAHAPVFAPFDQATTAFTADEGGHTYDVTVTPHRAN